MSVWKALWCFVCLVVYCAPATAQGPEGDWLQEEELRIDGGLTFTRFEQQVKSEIGETPGDVLVENMEFGANLFATYRVWSIIRLGFFTQLDVGVREASRFAGFASDGRATVSDTVGGEYVELWLGPLVRLQYWTLFVEVGYGALGLRWDDARDDLPTAGGDVESALQTHPGIAWLLAVGGGIPVLDELQVVFRVEYRVRYYISRDGQDLDPTGSDPVSHGTQNVTPFIGVAWTLDW